MKTKLSPIPAIIVLFISVGASAQDKKPDPKFINWGHQGQEVVSGPWSTLMGPVDEFERVLGWAEAPPGDEFTWMNRVECYTIPADK